MNMKTNHSPFTNMKNAFTLSRWRTLLPCSFILCALFGGITQGAPLGTTFTYQGRLTDGGIPATGSYDMDFALYDASTAGTLVGASPTITPAPVGVMNGLFTVTLDFGGTFAGKARWLEIAVRPNGSTAAYTVLSPRQLLTPAPQAIYALSAGTTASATSVPWAGLTGVPAGFADGRGSGFFGAGTVGAGAVDAGFSPGAAVGAAGERGSVGVSSA